MSSEAEIYKEMVAQHYRKGASSRRDADRRAVQVQDSPEALATEVIPERLPVNLFVSDGGTVGAAHAGRERGPLISTPVS
ncbi:hypothetical protein Aduo_005394 [Ancylostoma duodenale]